MENVFKQPNPENLFLIGRTISECQNLLPCYRSDVEKVIKDYIFFLSKINTD